MEDVKVPETASYQSPWRRLVVRWTARAALSGMIVTPFSGAVTLGESQKIDEACQRDYNAYIIEQAAEDAEDDDLPLPHDLPVITDTVNTPYISATQINTTSAANKLDLGAFNPWWYVEALVDYDEVQRFELLEAIDVRVRSDGLVRVNQESLNSHLRLIFALLADHPEPLVRAQSWCVEKAWKTDQFDHTRLELLIPSDKHACIGSLRIITDPEDYEHCNAQGFTMPNPAFFGLAMDQQLVVVTGNQRGRLEEVENWEEDVNFSVSHEIAGHLFTSLLHHTAAVTP